MRVHFSPEQGYKGQELALHCREQGHSQMACLTGGSNTMIGTRRSMREETLKQLILHFL